MSPVELLKHTEMAISPTIYQQHVKLIELDKQARGNLPPCRTWAYHDIQATTPDVRPIGPCHHQLLAVKQRQLTEKSGLADLEKVNTALERDVERFRRLQVNLNGKKKRKEV